MEVVAAAVEVVDARCAISRSPLPNQSRVLHGDSAVRKIVFSQPRVGELAALSAPRPS